MNTIFVSITNDRLKSWASKPAICTTPIDAVLAMETRETVAGVAKDIARSDPAMSQELLRANERLFRTNRLGQAFVNPIALGQVIFALDCVSSNVDRVEESRGGNGFSWTCIHPSIIKSSKQLYDDGHYAEAAVNAFIELNDRAKSLYKAANPNADDVPDGRDLMNKLLSPGKPIFEVRCAVQDSAKDFREGIHMMAAGAMAALRNPKSHSNEEMLTPEESMRRLMFASLLMYQLDGPSADGGA